MTRLSVFLEEMTEFHELFEGGRSQGLASEKAGRPEGRPAQWHSLLG
jgi:hypothetical protein